ncbi:MAG TPA: hypothetical protein PKC28_08795 [Bdellovibrionales bacterium]|nr:hypothetical protein [Bdellovibrionales bacterium]
MWKFKALAVLALVSAARFAFGAACCGGSFANPSLVAGDEKAQFTTSYAFTELAVDNVDSRGMWRKWDEHQQVQTLRLEGAHIFRDRWQAGASVPVVSRELNDESHSGLGDVATSLGYEYLPDWDYHPVRPKGLAFLQVTLPTGLARAESENGGLDSRGNGFLALGLGTLLSKTRGRFDLFTSVEVHRSLAKTVNNDQVHGKLAPGFGGSFGLGAGYSRRALRLGSAITWFYEDPIRIADRAKTGAERYATAALSLSYLASDLWAATVTYTDQTLFGDPVNTSLGRGVVFQLQRRWLR